MLVFHYQFYFDFYQQCSLMLSYVLQLSCEVSGDTFIPIDMVYYSFCKKLQEFPHIILLLYMTSHINYDTINVYWTIGVSNSFWRFLGVYFKGIGKIISLICFQILDLAYKNQRCESILYYYFSYI